MIVRLEEITFDNNADIWLDRYYNLKNIIHYHHEIELIYVEKGMVRVCVNSNNYIAAKGDIVVCNSGDVHTIESIGKSVCDILIFNEKIIKGFSDTHTLDNHIPKESLKSDPKELLGTIAHEINEQGKFYEEVVFGQITAFFARLYRKYAKVRSKADKTNLSYQGLISHIDKNYESVTFLEAAALMHYSAPHFSKVFKDISGITFSAYLNLVRVEKAVEKIKKGEGTITEIASACGFSTIRHFNRTFKAVTGRTPNTVDSGFVFTTNPTKVAQNMKTQQYTNNADGC